MNEHVPVCPILVNHFAHVGRKSANDVSGMMGDAKIEGQKHEMKSGR